MNATWQGILLQLREKDPELMKNMCFSWLIKWKDCSTRLINNLQSIYLQTVPTLTFTNYRNGVGGSSDVCRLCKNGQESIKHLLSNCGKFVNTAYVRRHDKALQCIMFHYLHMKSLINKCPPWYSDIIIKPMYENENVTFTWNIPEYSGYEEIKETDDEKVKRPDAKIILWDQKKIFIVEMSVPWLENRAIKIKEKIDKYVNIIQSLKVEYPNYKVEQLTFIIDCLGGFSIDLQHNIKKLGFNDIQCKGILYGMQKIVLTEASALIDRFKVLTLL